MANFMGLVFATLKNEGIDTKGMSNDEAVKKFNELKGKGDGTPAEQRKLEEKGIAKTDNERLETILKERNQNEDIDFAKDTDYFGYGSLDALEEAHNSGYKSENTENKNTQDSNKTSSNNIDYDNVTYPKGTSREYTSMVNDKYNKALPILEKAGISLDEFGGKPSKEGGYEDNSNEIMQKYVFEPFRNKYPKGNNDAWKNEFEPLYNAIDAVFDKNYNDFYIKNNQE